MKIPYISDRIGTLRRAAGYGLAIGGLSLLVACGRGEVAPTRVPSSISTPTQSEQVYQTPTPTLTPTRIPVEPTQPSRISYRISPNVPMAINEKGEVVGQINGVYAGVRLPNGNYLVPLSDREFFVLEEGFGFPDYRVNEDPEFINAVGKKIRDRVTLLLGESYNLDGIEVGVDQVSDSIVTINVKK